MLNHGVKRCGGFLMKLNSTVSNTLNFVFYVFYCNLKEKYLLEELQIVKKEIFTLEISIIVLIYQKLQSVRSVQQKIMLPSPNISLIFLLSLMK